MTGFSFMPSAAATLVPAVFVLRTMTTLYLWSTQKWQAGTGACTSAWLCPALLLKLQQDGWRAEG